ncbi:oligosaccharide flippase family protein [Paraburkholderia tropica]|uniref:PST family polysaccharide transporter n=1 Tax=Paraburkholderia tropica TaxID=92647 RepID=A0ABX5MXI4_9BURK|nr:oligosaccharide flippase family protein [Paraburkholderia tropica]MBB2997831.1 PST family polysaccharide transporter [Paraburkholderia tropica]MBB6316853.1 PST family polysaccharide transporter [Paraburkholderia tropica]MDE1142031.1 oligosaccharide flippase family protein [Paraburkholderia tropica]PXX20714.1 PST family polysaccharide transporter [Paraburkholderia tropica]PZW89792.1 PST family polysaccharide transporter [Paraburkholderia tropica]
MRAMRVPAWPVKAGFGPGAATWVLLQQVVVRGLVAVKFLVIGRILGPSAIGLASVALLAVAIAEALSDTGLAQAVIQGPTPPTRDQTGSVWTTLATRGLLIALLLVACAPLMDAQFHLGGALGLVQLAALLPLLRGLASPAYFIAQRERRFQHIAGIEIAAACVDCTVGVGLALTGMGPYALLLGMMVGEAFKSVLTWTTLAPRPPIRLRWSGIGHYVGFSRWIWASSVIILITNQFDKVVVGKLLGPAQLGAWQMSSKLAQMLLADAAIAMSQYLFPTFAAHHRGGAQAAARLFRIYLGVTALGLALVVIVLRFAAEPLFSLVLGAAWLSAVPLFRIFVINMAISALNSVLASYVRAVGDARAVTVASLIQVATLAVSVPIATQHWGVMGIAWSMTLGLASGAGWMLYRVWRKR